MKKLNFLNKIIFLINSVVAILLLLSLFVPYIKPSQFSLAPILGLATPALILVNLIFVLYWIILGFKRQFLLSTFALLINSMFLSPIYKFSRPSVKSNKNELKIMSYNVRKFNMYNWIADNEIPQKMSKFIEKEKPDIVTLQEYTENKSFKLNYKYYSNPHTDNYNDPIEKQKYKTPYAFYSKYPIINTGLCKNQNHQVNATYADIVKNKDTIRVLNLHLYSLGVIAEKDYLNYSDSKTLINRLSFSFKRQMNEINLIKKTINTTPFKTIIVGDINNTAYSWGYKTLKNKFRDTFLEAGQGFGKTYSYKGFPLRIDYIFTDNNFEVLEHKNYNVKYSDHYPIMATLSF